MSDTPHDMVRLKIANGDTVYVEVPVRESSGNRYIGEYISWPDAVSSATITLELTSLRHVAAAVAGTAAEWKDSGLSFTGPAATGAGALLINVENVRQRRARLKIVAAAVTNLDIRDGAA